MKIPKDKIILSMKDVRKSIRIPTAKGKIVFPDKTKYNRRKKHKGGTTNDHGK